MMESWRPEPDRTNRRGTVVDAMPRSTMFDGVTVAGSRATGEVRDNGSLTSTPIAPEAGVTEASLTAPRRAISATITVPATAVVVAEPRRLCPRTRAASVADPGAAGIANTPALFAVARNGRESTE